MTVLPLPPLLLQLALGVVLAAPELREENAVVPPAPAAPTPALRAAPLADVQAMMMEAVSCSPPDEERAMKRLFLTNTSVTCNDGSPAGFYVRRSAGSRRWLVLLEGGWYCHDTRSCHHRWQRLRHLMTSRLWPDQRNVGGILSPVPEENPYSWNANHVLVPYCSSDSWSGTSPAPTPGETFSFMGALIVQEVVRDLAAKGWLSNDSHVLLAGTSAGGTGVMLNVDGVQELVRALGLPRVSVRGLVDSGWFLDRPPFSPGAVAGPGAGPGLGRALTAAGALRQGMALWRARVPPACAARHRTDPWRCYFGYRLYPTVKAPLFLFQWLFDEAQMTADNVGAPVSKQQWDFIHEMGDSFRTTFSNVSAVFAPACIAHTVLTKRDWAAVRVGRVSLPAALRCWDNRLSADSPMEAPERRRGGSRKHKKGDGGGRVPCPTRHVEMCSWPQCNHSCPKLHNPFTGEEMNFIAVLKSFGLDMLSVANALGIDIHTLNNMDPEELLQLLTAS